MFNMSNLMYQVYIKTLNTSGVLFTLNIVKIGGKSKLLKELIFFRELVRYQIKYVCFDKSSFQGYPKNSFSSIRQIA
jgi:hypothetical protein